jgi:hypothetical protein
MSDLFLSLRKDRTDRSDLSNGNRPCVPGSNASVSPLYHAYLDPRPACHRCIMRTWIQGQRVTVAHGDLPRAIHRGHLSQYCLQLAQVTE